jgi:hypothetical protein
MKKIILLILLVGFICACGVDTGDNPPDFNGIPVLPNARVLEKVIDSGAAVHLLRFVTSLSEDEVVSFYKKKYKEPLSIKKYDSTTEMSYKNGDKNISILISSAPDGTDVYLMYEQ